MSQKFKSPETLLFSAGSPGTNGHIEKLYLLTHYNTTFPRSTSDVVSNLPMLTHPMWNVIVQSMNSPLANGSFYHIYNRGVEKRSIFQKPEDYQRFLVKLDYYRYHPIPRKLSIHLRFDLPSPSVDEKNQQVRIIAFCLMPNHFHLLIEQLRDGGISTFIRKISDSYTRYFNTKYERIGALFQGKFKAKLIESDEYLLQLSKYIHRNPMLLPMWKNRLSEYTFSSYPGYLNPKRNIQFCEYKTVLDFFGKSKSLSYQSFVEETEEIPLPENLFIDMDLA